MIISACVVCQVSVRELFQEGLRYKLLLLFILHDNRYKV